MVWVKSTQCQWAKATSTGTTSFSFSLNTMTVVWRLTPSSRGIYLSLCDILLQVAGVFFKSLSKEFTYHSDPDSCCLKYGITLFGPIQWLSDSNYQWMGLVSLCMQGALLWISLELTHFLFGDKGMTMHSLSCFEFSESTTGNNVLGCIALWPRIKCTALRLSSCVWQAALHHWGNVQANLPLFPLWFSSFCCRSRDWW